MARLELDQISSLLPENDLRTMIAETEREIFGDAFDGEFKPERRGPPKTEEEGKGDTGIYRFHKYWDLLRDLSTVMAHRDLLQAEVVRLRRALYKKPRQVV